MTSGSCFRRQHNSEHLQSGEISNSSLYEGQLDASLGYLPNQPEAVRSVTNLVIKKREERELEESRKARKRGRFRGESALNSPHSSSVKLTAEVQ